MTITETLQETSGETVVSVIDSDVHPTPKPGALLEFLPEKFHRYSRLPGRELMELPNYYDVPDFSETSAMRADTFPPEGGFPCSDPDFATKQLLIDGGVDLAILEPVGSTSALPEVEHALKAATNDWLAKEWLSAPHGRWRGSISVSNAAPQAAAEEIDRWGKDRRFVQVLVSPQTNPGFGDPSYDPIYEAAERNGLPVCTHLMSLGPYEKTPLMPFGNQAHWADFMAAWPLLFTTHLMSLVFDGTFERYPGLKIVFVEGAFTWVLPSLWRMDRVWEKRKDDVPFLTRKPSEYVRDHVRFTTQPLEEPDNASEFKNYLNWMDAGDLLLFSTDYPHWSFDDPKWVIHQLPEQMRERIMWRNATELYGLPRTVPAFG